jgi:hypothetical protein
MSVCFVRIDTPTILEGNGFFTEVRHAAADSMNFARSNVCGHSARTPSIGEFVVLACDAITLKSDTGNTDASSVTIFMLSAPCSNGVMIGRKRSARVGARIRTGVAPSRFLSRLQGPRLRCPLSRPGQ